MDLFYGDPAAPGDGSNVAHILRNSTNTTGAYELNSNTTNYFTIGTNGLTESDDQFYGIVDEVAFWRKSLVIDDIFAIYNFGRGWPYPFKYPRPY